MKIYKTLTAIVVEHEENFYSFNGANWNEFINRDNIYSELLETLKNTQPSETAKTLVLQSDLHPPMDSQELWASGVTYFRSKEGRQAESEKSGGADFYQRVYEAERPELFFKATVNRVVGSGGLVRIRRDSTWDVPEPELVLVTTASGKIIGYSIGNDMSSRSIEGENPLYLPQAKTYDGCAALGPCILLTEQPLNVNTEIHLSIEREGENIFSDQIAINQITRKFEDLVEFLYRESSFPYGALLMTGTGIVPGDGFTLQSGDIVNISIDGIGCLTNAVA